MNRLKAHWLQILTHGLALLPLALLVWDFTQNQLTADPIREVTLRTGRVALTLLVLSLTCTPIHIVFGFRWPLRVRRLLGLYAFLYAMLHGLTFVGLDYQFDWGLIGEEILQKRFVQMGILTFLILLPLALTSTRGWMKLLGKRWKRLHRLIYLAGLLAVVHFTWAVKADISEPLLYGLVVILLLIVRIPVVRNAVQHLRDRLSGKSRTPEEPGASS
ncbi:MAG: sulfoxide reductase heme-binding subunit YedZ [Chloroflexi bacterium]|nr:sulfoxide reductase heme-binding subunit YedZ [Chloroflexota bacterium]MBU1746933.1 sulfoxide reductase heme-binding subunit YedZ [Chloroflexota bacterium]